MARRRNGLLDDLIEIASRIPWWAGLIAALVSYVLLHRAALIEVPKSAATLDAMGASAQKQLFKTIGWFAQFLVPGALLMGSLISAVRSFRGRRLFETTTARGGRSALLEMSWQDFEGLVGEYFRRRGFSVRPHGGHGADGGVDLTVDKGGEIFLVQCKRWRATKVGVEIVRELYGVMAARGATGAFVVSSGEFTEQAKREIVGTNIELIDGAQLMQLMSSDGSRAATSAKAEGSTARSAIQCPVCQSPMVKRVAKHGHHAGKEFWGCSRYPTCKGTRRAEA